MRDYWKHQKLWAVLLMLLATVQPAYADDDPMQDPAIQKVLRAMGTASTWYHPDLFGEFAGMRHYEHHQYQDAYKYFEIGAYYADKLSQISIGLMHLNGEGAPKDPVTAYAWIDLAAERDYPDFVATRDRIKATLTPQQLEQAMALRKTLGARYGDEFAKPRMAQQLRFGMEQMTGSHLGFDSGNIHLSVKQNCGAGVVVGGQSVAEAGCGSDAIYAKERWDPKLYFDARDRQYKATVTVGKLNSVTSTPGSAPPAAPPAPVEGAAAAQSATKQ
jgi:hypothetical protein